MSNRLASKSHPIILRAHFPFYCLMMDFFSPYTGDDDDDDDDDEDTSLPDDGDFGFGEEGFDDDNDENELSIVADDDDNF